MYDEKLATTFVGRRILVGLTYVDADQKPIEQRQFHGVITRVSEKEGVVIRVANSDEDYVLPPALEAISVAPKGEYRLRSTGEVVVDPDLMTTWTVNREH